MRKVGRVGIPPKPGQRKPSWLRTRSKIENRFDGHIVRIKGDGALSIFGFPAAHENDAERAVRAGLALTQAVHELPSPPGSDESLELAGFE